MKYVVKYAQKMLYLRREINMTKSILLVGVGGQGTILASKLLTTGLMNAGYDVKMSEIHGMSQRGGSVSSQVRYGEKVYSPVIEIGGADILVSFEKMEALRWLATLRRAPIRILGTETKKLRNREVKLVKVQWGEAEEDATWETEEKMRGLYPFLFEGTLSISFLCLAYLSLCYPCLSSYRANLVMRTLGRNPLDETCV